MMSNDHDLNLQIKNTSFAILDSIFKQHHWHVIRNEVNQICYTKFGDETSYFDIKNLPDKIIFILFLALFALSKYFMLLDFFVLLLFLNYFNCIRQISFF